jgi:hypothetical protein
MVSGVIKHNAQRFIGYFPKSLPMLFLNAEKLIARLYFAMNSNLEKVKQLAPDLRSSEPRSPEVPLAGIRKGARCLDKCRATLVGQQGEFIYACPMDSQFLSAAGVDADEFKEFVATGASDAEVESWLKRSKN